MIYCFRKHAPSTLQEVDVISVFEKGCFMMICTETQEIRVDWAGVPSEKPLKSLISGLLDHVDPTGTADSYSSSFLASLSAIQIYY